MKRVTFLLACFLMVAVSTFAGDDRITHDVQELPARSRQFLATHFAGKPVAHIKIEKNLLWVESYDVILTDGTQVEFERSGAWKEVKGDPAALPAALIPAFAGEYVRRHYPGVAVKGIDRSDRHCEVDLTNGVELKFDNQGNLVDIDH